MKFFEIGAEVLVPKFTRAEVRLPGYCSYFFNEQYSKKTKKAKLNRTEVQLFRDLDQDFLYTYHVKPHEDVDPTDHTKPKEGLPMFF